MAQGTNEKTWAFRHNVNCNGTGSANIDVSQNFIYNLFQTLATGNGNSDAAWTIERSSNGDSAGAGAGQILNSGDFKWNTAGNAHSWFLASKEGLLPNSGSGDPVKLYFMVDCEGADVGKCWFGWGYAAPSDDGSTTARPAEVSSWFEKDAGSFMVGYDAGFPTYFNSSIDTTGSFIVIGSRNQTSNNNYQFWLMTQRLETPRTHAVDPYPVYMRCAWMSNDANQGTGRDGAGPFSWDIWNANHYSFWYDTESCVGMWWVNGVHDQANYGPNTVMLTPMPYAGYTYYNPWYKFYTAGSTIDATYPLLDEYMFFSEYNSAAMASIRGRVCDIHMANAYYNMDGSTLSGSDGNIFKSQVGCLWFPATASLLPGG